MNVDRQNPTDLQLDSAMSFHSKSGWDFPRYFDIGLTNFDRLGVTAVPSTFVFDSAGTLVWMMAGYLIDNRQSMVDRLLETAPPVTIWRSNVKPKAIRYYRLGRIMMQNGERRMAEVNLAYAASEDSTFPDPRTLLVDSNASNESNVRNHHWEQM